MPPSVEPVRQQIIDKIVDVMKTIVAGPSFFFGAFIVSKDERELSDEDRSNWPFVLVTQNEEEGDIELLANDRIVETFTVDVFMFAESTGFPKSVDAEHMVHDLTKAAELNTRLGNLVDFMFVSQVTPAWSEESNIVSGVVKLQIQYERARGTP